MSFLWPWGGSRVAEASQEPDSPDDGDEPIDQGAKHKPAAAKAKAKPTPLTDDEKWKESVARCMPLIKPTDPEFIEKKAEFERDLSKKSGLSIDDVLRKYFSRYEIRKISEYADKKRDSHLFEQQKEHAAQYKALLQAKAWQKEGEKASMSTKLTMAYFGLPVEPLTMQDLFPGVSSTLFTNIDDDDIDPRDDSIFMREDRRPLRFLNFYDKRGWGKDNSHLMPNQTFEAYYRLPWVPPRSHHHRHHRDPEYTNLPEDLYSPGLRGGGLSSEDEEEESLFTDDDMMDDMGDIDDMDVASVASDTPMKDAQCAAGDDSHSDGVSLRGGAAPGQDLEETAFLYGFLGRQTCRINQPASFFVAIDDLLALQDRQDNAGHGIPLTFAFLIINGTDRDERFGVCKQFLHGVIGQSPQQEQALHAKVQQANLEQKSALKDQHSTAIIFVCFQHQGAPFRDGLGKNVAFQPSFKDDDCIKFSIFNEKDDPKDRYPASYMWLPPNINENTASNYYEEWFRAAWQASSNHVVTDERLGRVKALPSKRYLLTLNGISFHSQMPLPRDAWGSIFESLETGNKRFVIGIDEQSKTVTYSVPGYASLGSTPEHRSVFALAWDSIPESDRSSVVQIDVKPWDVPFYAENPEITSFTCKDGKVVKGDARYSDSKAQLGKMLGGTRALIIQPRWRSYDAHLVDGDGNELPVLSLALDDLRGDWPQVLKLIRDSFVKAKKWQDKSVIRIDQGNPRVYDTLTVEDQPLERQLSNRTSWDFEPVDSDEMYNLWQQFVHLVSFHEFEISLIPKVDQNGEPDVGDPLGLKKRKPEKHLWGYNAPRFAGGNQPAAIYPVGTETQHEQETRAVGFEPSTIGGKDLQDIGSTRVSFQRDQFPGIQPLDSAQRGKAFREWSYGLPLSIHMKNQYPEIPINAPPLEALFKQRGPDGLASSSLPVISTQILTPTEQRRLQESFFRMRSIALNRGQMCPHKGCIAYFPVDPDNMHKFHAHLEQKHVGSHCPFCPETLFAHWPPEQRQKHFVDKHSEYFTRKGDLLKEARLADSIKNKELVHRREEQYSFCPRCGRNHNLLNSKADRVQHDNTCFPGNGIHSAKMTYCTFCGDPEINASGTAQQRWVAHECQVSREPGATPAADAFCKNCALPCNKLGVSYARRHLLHCKPADTGRDNWCPWCGIDLKSGPQKQRLQHLEDCGLKPFTGENPVDTETGQAKESPRDNPELVRRSFFRPSRGEGYDRVVVPDLCPLEGCQKDLSLLNARGLLTHFTSNHPEGTNGMNHCPFCRVDFVARKWTLREEKQAHFQDHIDRRYERVISDETISRSKDWESQEVKDAFVKREQNFLDPAKKITELQKEAVATAEERLRLSRENQRLKQAVSQAAGKTDGAGAGPRRLQRRQPQPRQQPQQRQPVAWLLPTQTRTSVPIRPAGATTAYVTPPAATSEAKPDAVTTPQARSPTQQPTPASSSGLAQQEVRKQARTPVQAPAQPPARRRDDDELASRPSGSGRRNRAGAGASGNDGLYRPGRFSDDDDDNYQEGLVPEPNPDLDITMEAAPVSQTSQATETIAEERKRLAPGVRFTPPNMTSGATRRSVAIKRSASPAQADGAKKQRTTAAVPGPSSAGSPSGSRNKRPSGAPVAVNLGASGSLAKPTQSDKASPPSKMEADGEGYDW